MNMGRIDDQASLFGDDLLQLVHHLSGGPNFIIHAWCSTKHDPKGFLFEDNMDF